MQSNDFGIYFVTSKFIGADISKSIDPRGSVIHLYNLATGLVDKGFTVTIVQPSIHKFKRVFKKVHITGLPATTLAEFNNKWPQYIQKEVPAGSHIHIHLNDIDCLPKNKIPYKPTVTIHTNIFLEDRAAQLDFRQQLDRFEKVIVVNREYLKRFSGKIKEKFKLIRNGVDLSIFNYKNKTPDSKKCRIFFPNIPSPKKGLDLAIDTVETLTKIAPNIEWSLVAPFDFKGKSSLPIWLSFVPPIAPGRKMARAYHLADMSIIPSSSESCSIACLESMACGVPVIASDIPGMREVLFHKKTHIK